MISPYECLQCVNGKQADFLAGLPIWKHVSEMNTQFGKQAGTSQTQIHLYFLQPVILKIPSDSSTC